MAKCIFSEMSSNFLQKGMDDSMFYFLRYIGIFNTKVD